MNPIEREKPDWREAVVLLFLNLVTLGIFAQVLGFEFLNYDDPEYVVANGPILNGISFSGIRWALTTFHAGN